MNGAYLECGEGGCCLSPGHSGRHYRYRYRPWSRERSLRAMWRRTGSLYADDFGAEYTKATAPVRWRELRAEQVGRWTATWGYAVG